MRIGALVLMAALALSAPVARAQEHAPEKAAGHAEQAPAKAGGDEHGAEKAGEHGEAAGGHASMDGWKWANFALLAGVLGYMVKKNAGPFFAARSEQIRREMKEAEDLSRSAEGRAADVDRRLANLESEIAALRTEAAREAEAERERLAHHAAAEIAKIQAHAEREIGSAGKAARTELKRYSAGLAIGLAEQKIRARMTPESEAALVERFVQNLK